MLNCYRSFTEPSILPHPFQHADGVDLSNSNERRAPPSTDRHAFMDFDHPTESRRRRSSVHEEKGRRHSVHQLDDVKSARRASWGEPAVVLQRPVSTEGLSDLDIGSVEVRACIVMLNEDIQCLSPSQSHGQPHATETRRWLRTSTWSIRVGAAGPRR